MAMSEKVQAEYDKAMAQVTIKHGTLVSKSPSLYGWESYSWTDGDDAEHLVRCGVKPGAVLRAVEDTWDKFAGTFYEGDTSHHGVIVKGISCSCGRLTGRSIRWEASVHEVAEAIFGHVFSQKKAS